MVKSQKVKNQKKRRAELGSAPKQTKPIGDPETSSG